MVKEQVVLLVYPKRGESSAWLMRAAKKIMSSRSKIMVSPRHRPNIGLVLGQRRRRWHIIKPTLDGYWIGHWIPGATVNYYISVRSVVNDHLFWHFIPMYKL